MKQSKRFNSIAIIIFLILILLGQSCEKFFEPDNSPEYIINDSIQSNVSLIDSAEVILTSDSTLLEEGIYKFQYSATPPEFSKGDIIVGQKGSGYLRKVLSSTVEGNTVTLATEQATLGDLYQDANISFEVPVNQDVKKSLGVEQVNEEVQLAEGVKILEGDGINLSLSNFQLKAGPNLSVKLASASISISPDFNYRQEIRDGETTGASFISYDTPVKFSYNMSASGIVNSDDKIQKVIFKRKIRWLIGILVVAVEHEVKLVYEPSINVGIDLNYNSTTEYVYDLGVAWGDVTDNYIFEKKSELENVTNNSLSVQAGGKMKFSVVYTPTLSIYEVDGPYLENSYYGVFEGGVSTSQDWNINMGLGLQSTIGMKFGILFLDKLDLSKTFTLSKPDFYVLPKTLEITEGNSQSGMIAEELSWPVVVRVLDSWDEGVSNVKVYFIPKTDMGSVENEFAYTDEYGYAETYWTLGETPGTQEMEVFVKNADGSYIEDAPLTFTAEGEENKDEEITAMLIDHSPWKQYNENFELISTWVFNEGGTGTQDAVGRQSAVLSNWYVLNSEVFYHHKECIPSTDICYESDRSFVVELIDEATFLVGNTTFIGE